MTAGECANCGEALNADGTKHHNDIVFCAFVAPPFDWNNWKTARQLDLESRGGG